MRVVAATMSVLLLVLIVACGKGEGPGELATGTPDMMATGTPERAQGPTATATPPGVAVTSTAAATPIPAEETPTTNDIISRVLVETNQQEYRQNEAIVVTITNNLDTSITTFDQQAFCSIVRLERQDGTEWREVRNCFSGVPRTEVTLKPGAETVVQLSAHLLPALSPGIYRALMIFSLGETFNFGKSFLASSPLFSVQ